MSFRESFELHAPAETVFDALVEEATLRKWLAEHVRVDPHKGGVYRFWGRDVIWCADESETEGEILEFDRPRALEIGWRWKGHASRIGFRVEADGGKCRLVIEHRFETFDPGPEGPGPDMAGCHWRIAVANLSAVLDRGRASLRPDYTAHDRTGTGRVELEIEIDAPVERVFEALLDPQKVKRWMQADAAEIDAGSGRYSYGWRRDEAEVGPVRILELVPNRLLVHDWRWVGEPDASVRWELTPTESGTRLRLVHSNSSTITHVLGWSDAVLGIQRFVAEGVHVPS